MKAFKLTIAGAGLLLVSACSYSSSSELLQGPPVQNVTTPYDNMMACLQQQSPGLDRRFTVAVAEFADRTGKFNYASEEGTGYFVTQGGADILTTELAHTGLVSVVERQNTKVLEWELARANQNLLGDAPNRVRPVGLKNNGALIRGSDIYFAGSINTADINVISNGAQAEIAGIGPRARAFRMVVALDMRAIDTRTGQVLSSTKLSKQFVGDDVGFGIGRFFGNTLVNVDLGQKRNEALQLGLRSMIQLGAAQILKHLYQIEGCGDPMAMVDKGEVKNMKKTSGNGDKAPTPVKTTPKGTAPKATPKSTPASQPVIDHRCWQGGQQVSCESI